MYISRVYFLAIMLINYLIILNIISQNDLKYKFCHCPRCVQCEFYVFKRKQKNINTHSLRSKFGAIGKYTMKIICDYDNYLN